MVVQFAVMRDLYLYERIEWRNLAHLVAGGRYLSGFVPAIWQGDATDLRCALASAGKRMFRHVLALVRLFGSK